MGIRGTFITEWGIYLGDVPLKYGGCQQVLLASDKCKSAGQWL
jgi:hypothetical protein